MDEERKADDQEEDFRIRDNFPFEIFRLGKFSLWLLRLAKDFVDCDGGEFPVNQSSFSLQSSWWHRCAAAMAIIAHILIRWTRRQGVRCAYKTLDRCSLWHVIKAAAAAAVAAIEYRSVRERLTES